MNFNDVNLEEMTAKKKIAVPTAYNIMEWKDSFSEFGRFPASSQT